MRNLLFLIILLFLGCKDDFDLNKYLYDKYLKEYAEYIQSFKIQNPEGLTITNIGNIQGDTTVITLSGIRNRKVWFGKFDKYTKEQLFEWNDFEFLPQNRKIDNITLPISFAYAGGPIINSNDSTYTFIIYQSDSPFTAYFADLCFLNGKELNKIEGDINVNKAIHLWIENTILTEGKPWACFSTAGEKLYDFHKGVTAGTPINIEECINESINGFKRVNLKTGEIKWQTNKLYEDLSANLPAIFNKTSENGSIWTYEIIIDQIQRKFEIDINTGEITYK